MIKKITLALLCSAMIVSVSQPAFAIDLNVDTDETNLKDDNTSTTNDSSNTAFTNSVVGGYLNTTEAKHSVAIGHVNTATGEKSVAIGRGNTAGAGSSSALGTQNYTAGEITAGISTGGNSSAIGANNVTGTIVVNPGPNGDVITVIDTAEKATAVGYSNNAVGDNSTALGSKNMAGYFQEDDPDTTEVETTIETSQATAVGYSSAALADKSIAIGSEAIAGEVVNTDNAGVITTTVAGKNTIAIGTSSEALGDNAIALGAGANAKFLNSTAIGVDAHALHDNSTAIGVDAETSQANQIMLGTVDDTITAPGVYSHSGDVTTGRLVTVDELGNLGSVETSTITVVGGNDAATLSAGQIAIKDGSITSSDLADGAVSYNKLGEDVKAKFNTHEQGIATAMAMANIPALSGDSQYSIGIAMGAFEDEIGFALGGSARLGDTGPIIQASLGQSGGTYSGAVGLSWAW